MLKGGDGQSQGVKRIVGAIEKWNPHDDDIAWELCWRLFNCKLNHSPNTRLKNLCCVAAVAGVANPKQIWLQLNHAGDLCGES